jgi:DNA-binding NarL/FixJ family response regulator
MTRVIALVGDLMDRTRLTGAIAGLALAASAADTRGADVVIVDLARHADALDDVRAVAPDAFVVAYGPHVDTDTLAAARAAGADEVLARSRFFRDPAAAATPPDQ